MKGSGKGGGKGSGKGGGKGSGKGSNKGYKGGHNSGKGFGKILLGYLGALALERNCGRLEWWVLDWNQPAKDFYQSLGAEPMDDWTVNRVTGTALNNLAAIYDNSSKSNESKTL